MLATTFVLMSSQIVSGLDAIHSIAVVGAGVMGQGIAIVAAEAGYAIRVFDTQEAALARTRTALEQHLKKAIEKQRTTPEAAEATRGRFSYTTDIAEVVADVIIEAAPERMELKHDLMRKLEAHNSPTALVATNTSSLSVTQIAAALQHPGRCVGMHFFNPAPLMKLVEVVAGERTAPEVAALTMALAQRMGKTAVRTADTPGFIVNRVARHYYLEAMRIAEESGADIETLQTIDTLLEATGFKMGPFKLMDLIGHDTNFAVTRSLYEAYWQAPRFRPSRLQEAKVHAGKLGRKTGEGFFKYDS